MLCKVKIHWNSNITPKSDYTEEFSFGFISIIAALNVILMKNNSLVHANTFGQGTCSFFATEQTWRQKANDRRPPSMDFDFLWKKSWSGAKVDAKDNVFPPQEQPAKTPWMWQKSMIQQATNKNTEDKSEKNEWPNKIWQVSWDDFIPQWMVITIAHIAYYVK